MDCTTWFRLIVGMWILVLIVGVDGKDCKTRSFMFLSA